VAHPSRISKGGDFQTPPSEVLSQKPAITPNPKPKLAVPRFFCFQPGSAPTSVVPLSCHQQSLYPLAKVFHSPPQYLFFSCDI
jgi:hypothetical protein